MNSEEWIVKKFFCFWSTLPIALAIVCIVNKEFSARAVWAFYARGEYRRSDDARKYSWGESRSGFIYYAKQWETEGRSVWGALSFGYDVQDVQVPWLHGCNGTVFILDKQNKVTRQQGEKRWITNSE